MIFFFSFIYTECHIYQKTMSDISSVWGVQGVSSACCWQIVFTLAPSQTLLKNVGAVNERPQEFYRVWEEGYKTKPKVTLRKKSVAVVVVTEVVLL